MNTLRIPTASILLVLGLMCSLDAGSTSAQTATLRGFVTDAVSEQLLQGATVAIRDSSGVLRGTVTDGDGYFIVRGIPAGRHEVTVSFVGYTRWEEDIILRSGEVVIRNIDLAPADMELDEVVIQGERASGVASVVAGLQAIDPAQIERVPVLGISGDLAAYLQTVPGVLNQGDRGGQYFIRGGALDQNLSLIDGLPVYMPFHVLSFYSAFPEEIIDTARLYTGGFGARYGTRVSSVIDVRTRRGNKQNLAGELGVSPFLSSVRIEGPLVRNRVSFIGSVRQSLVTRVFPDLFGSGVPADFGDRFGKLHAFLTPQRSLEITALSTNDRGDLAGDKKRFDGEPDSEFLVPDDSTEVAWDNLVIGGRYTWLPDGSPHLVEITAGYSESTNEVGAEGSPERFSKINSFDVAVDWTVFFGEGQLRFGSRYRESDFSYELSGQFQSLEQGSSELREFSGYLEGDIAPTARLSLNPGVHLYVLPDRDEIYLEPRLRANWQLDDRVTVNAATGLYRQATVGLNDRRDVGNVYTLWTNVPADRDMPVSIHGILGANIQAGTGLTVAVEGFMKKFSTLSVPVFSAFPGFSTAMQSAEGLARGADVRLEFQDTPFVSESIFDGYLSYTLAHVEYETPRFTYTPAHDRRHQFNAMLRARRGDVRFLVQWQYGTGLPFTSSSGFDVWHLLTPEVDVASDPGVERVLYNEPFARRQPVYNRVDLWLERRVEQGRFVSTLRAGVINALNRENLFYYDLFTFKRVDQLPIIPSIGYKLEFR